MFQPRLRTLAISLAFLAVPALAHAAGGLTPIKIIAHAAPFVKLIMLGLAVAAVVAVVITVRKLASGPKLDGGSAFVSGLRAGGPLAGLLGASYGAMNSAIGMSNVPYDVTLKILAPGIAEDFFMITLGILAGSVAVICHWALEARIDRAVLKA